LPGPWLPLLKQPAAQNRTSGSLRPARLRLSELIRLGGYGLRSCPLRAVLSALGIAIGIAAMIAVVGISASSHADLDRQLAKLGTNMLTVLPGKTMFGKPVTLPDESVAMIKRIAPVQPATATACSMTCMSIATTGSRRRRPAA
jgi:putative ABC transport system permease protein